MGLGDKPVSNSTSSELESIPTISGAKNQSGFDKAIPLVLGRHRFTPYYCGNPYRTVSGTDGEKQTFHALYMLGYNNLQVTDIKLGLIDLAYNRDYEKNGQTVSVETVDDGMIEVNGRWNKDKYNIKLELKQNEEEASLYPQKVVEEQLNIELLKVEESEYQKVLTGYKITYNYTDTRWSGTRTDTVTFSVSQLENTSASAYLKKNNPTYKTVTLIKTENIYKDTEVLLNSNTLIAERFSAKNPQIIEVEFTLDGLLKYDSEGKLLDKEVGVKIELSLDGGLTYEPFAKIEGEGITYNSQTGESVIRRHKNKVMRFIARRELTYDEAINCKNRIAELRIQKTTVSDTDDNVSDTVYLSGIRTWCYDYKKSKATENTSDKHLVAQSPLIESRKKMTARLAIEIEADELEFKNQLDSLNALLTMKGKTYDGQKWSEELTATNNPASCMLTVLEHASRGKYAYDDKKIDYEKVGEFYQWCNQQREEGDDTPKYQCNGILTNQKKTRDIIDAILSTARAKLILDDKKYSVWIDKERKIPVMVLNNQNVLSAANQKMFNDLPDGYKIKFVNEMTWQTDEIKVLNDGVDEEAPNLTYESIELLFQTDAKQVWQNGRYLLACERLRQETWNRKVSVDGNLIDIGSLVELQDDTISVGIGDGAEVKSLVIEEGEIKAIQTDADIYVDDLTKRYGIKVTCADGRHEPKVMSWEVKVENKGVQSLFKLVNPLSVNDIYKPNVGDIVSFGFFERETISALCFGKKDNGDGTFDLTLVPYQSGVYTADVAEIPEFDSKVCDIPERSAGSYQIDSSKEAIAKMNEKTSEAILEIKAAGLQPYIYSDISSTGLYVDSDNITTQKQMLDILCHVIYANEEREFSFGELNLPAGWQGVTDYHTVKLTIPSCVKITEGSFNIPIRYREVFEDATLVDENGNAYADENGDVYHTCRLGNEILTYNLPFSFVGVKGGNYKGRFNGITSDSLTLTENISGQSVITKTKAFNTFVEGDYITWTGELHSDSRVLGSFLRTSRLYKYCGMFSEYLFKEDTDQVHNMNALTDVFSVLNDELGNNKNNTATQYLSKLVANDIFVDKLVANDIFVSKLVADEAFITKLSTKIISLQNGGIIKSDNYNPSSIIEVDGKKIIDTSNYSDTGFAMDSEGHADFVGLHATDMVAVNLKCQGGEFSEITTRNVIISENSVIAGDVIFNGTINNSILQAGGEIVSDLRTYPKGTTMETFRSQFPDSKILPCLCVHNNEVLSYFKYARYSGRSAVPHADHLYLYDTSGTMKYSWLLGYEGIPTVYYTLTDTLTIQFLSPSDGALLKLIGLPAADPHIINAVYKDTNNYLKISDG